MSISALLVRAFLLLSLPACGSDDRPATVGGAGGVGAFAMGDGTGGTVASDTGAVGAGPPAGNGLPGTGGNGEGSGGAGVGGSDGTGSGAAGDGDGSSQAGDGDGVTGKPGLGDRYWDSVVRYGDVRCMCNQNIMGCTADGFTVDLDCERSMVNDQSEDLSEVLECDILNRDADTACLAEAACDSDEVRDCGNVDQPGCGASPLLTTIITRCAR